LTDKTTPPPADTLVDYFITKDGQTFAGNHLLVEIWGAKWLTDSARVDIILCEPERMDVRELRRGIVKS